MGMNHIIKFATAALEPDAMEEIAPEEWEDAWGEEEVAIGNHDQCDNLDIDWFIPSTKQWLTK